MLKRSPLGDTAWEAESLMGPTLDAILSKSGSRSSSGKECILGF